MHDESLSYMNFPLVLYEITYSLRTIIISKLEKEKKQTLVLRFVYFL